MVLFSMNRTFRENGFTLLEVVFGCSILAVSLLSLGGILVSVRTQRRDVALQTRVFLAAQSVVEEVRVADPPQISAYDGKVYPVENVTGLLQDDGVIRVAVDTSDRALLGVTVTAFWLDGRGERAMEFYTRIHDPGG